MAKCIVVMPKTSRGFELAFIAALAAASAPVHIWVNGLFRGFVMRIADYVAWMEKGDGPIEVASPRLVTIHCLECGDELDRAIGLLEEEVKRAQHSGWTIATSDDPASMNRVVNSFFGPR